MNIEQPATQAGVAPGPRAAASRSALAAPGKSGLQAAGPTPFDQLMSLLGAGSDALAAPLDGEPPPDAAAAPPEGLAMGDPEASDGQGQGEDQRNLALMQAQAVRLDAAVAAPVPAPPSPFEGGLATDPGRAPGRAGLPAGMPEALSTGAPKAPGAGVGSAAATPSSAPAGAQEASIATADWAGLLDELGAQPTGQPKPALAGGLGLARSRPAATAVAHEVRTPLERPERAVGEVPVQPAALRAMADAAALRVDPGLAVREPLRREAQAMPTSGLPTLDAQPGMQANGLTSYASAAVDAAVPAQEVAQKLHYWIQGGVQHASLQVDAFGPEPVEVSISLQGNEAMVEFACDQPEVRRLLQEALPELESMLREEGLKLSGSFVGQSGRDGGEMPQREQAQRAAMVRLALPQPEPVPRAGVPSASGARLDVFV